MNTFTRIIFSSKHWHYEAKIHTLLIDYGSYLFVQFYPCSTRHYKLHFVFQNNVGYGQFSNRSCDISWQLLLQHFVEWKWSNEIKQKASKNMFLSHYNGMCLKCTFISWVNVGSNLNISPCSKCVHKARFTIHLKMTEKYSKKKQYKFHFLFSTDRLKLSPCHRDQVIHVHYVACQLTMVVKQQIPSRKSFMSSAVL